MESKLGSLYFRFVPTDSDYGIRRLDSSSTDGEILRLYGLEKDKLSKTGKDGIQLYVVFSPITLLNLDDEGTIRYWANRLTSLNIPVIGATYMMSQFLEKCKKLCQLNALGT